MLIYGVEIEAHATRDRQRGSQWATAAAHLVRGLGICLDSGLGSRGIALGLILQSPGKRALNCSQCWAGGNLLRAADLELVGSSRTGVTGFVRCRTDDLIF